MIEINSNPLLLFIIFTVAITLFHIFFLIILGKLDTQYTSFLLILDPIIVISGIFIFPDYSMQLFFGLASSFIIIAILANIVKPIKHAVISFKAQRKTNTPVWKILGRGTLTLLVYASILYFGLLYTLLIIAFVMALNYILPSNKNRFYFYQRTLPTSLIKNVAMGLAEITGKAKAINPLISPQTKSLCIGYIYIVEEIHTSTNNEGKKTKSYHTISKEKKINNFTMEDESGEIEVFVENLEWIDIPSSYFIEIGEYRYTEYILNDDTNFILVGQAFYQSSRQIFRYDENNGVFGIAPLKTVNLFNKWRPLKIKALTTLSIIGGIYAVIALTPMRIEGSKLIIEKKDWKEVFRIKSKGFLNS
ncbi:hypothetical protein [Chryseobacterium sp.]|uniref:hypothetical protein n=1 Tax=Chryseobacterium sp. TaxID=1871047 RepID=UPI0025C2ECB9|nr:hypothetical protein [Chryseobacterium sp.]